MVSAEKQVEVLRMTGHTIRSISRMTGVSRGAVSSILRRGCVVDPNEAQHGSAPYAEFGKPAEVGRCHKHGCVRFPCLACHVESIKTSGGQKVE